MIVPTKGINPHRALVTIGGEIVGTLEQPMTVSRLWITIRDRHNQSPDTKIGFDWYILALDLLFSIDAVRLGEDNFLVRTSP